MHWVAFSVILYLKSQYKVRILFLHCFLKPLKSSRPGVYLRETCSTLI